VFLAVSMVFAVLVVNAFFPVRREPFTVASFALGWIPGELPLHGGGGGGGRDGGLRRSTGPCAPGPGWVGLGVAGGLRWPGFVRLAVVAHGAGALVDEALDRATGGGGVRRPRSRPAWNHWWRLVIAVPFRFRGIRRARNIDYWGDGNYRHKLDILTRARWCPSGPRCWCTSTAAPGSSGTSASRGSP
jgi:hypothetical protein